MARCSSFALILCLTLAAIALAGTAHAGPVEKFSDSSSNAATIALAYEYGSGGFFLSNDKGAHFKLLCSNAVDANVRDHATLRVSDEGIYLGVYDGAWLGDKNGCGWKRVPELEGQWTGAMAGDPVDPKITYYATSAGAKPNGLYKRDTSGKWAEFGTKSDVFINSLDVVKISSGKRYYASAVRSVPSSDPMMPDTPHYMVRISEDEAKTWTENEFGPADQYGSKDPQAEMKIVAIDPTNPDRIVVRAARTEGSDELLFSPMQGKAGSWVKIGQGKDLRGVAFAPDGKLYYGDNDQETPGFFKVDNLGDSPKQLNNGWKVSCLRWDANNDRMFACHDWQFGSANLDTGAFSPMLDMRSVDSFVDCPGEAPVSMRCQSQLLAAYCGQGHYEYASVCSVYDPVRPWFVPMSADAGGSSGAAGAAGMSAAVGGAGGSGSGASGNGGAGASASGTTGLAGTRASAGTSAQAGTGSAGTTAPPKSGSGCSCMAPVGPNLRASDALAGLGALGGVWLVRRRRRTR